MTVRGELQVVEAERERLVRQLDDVEEQLKRSETTESIGEASARTMLGDVAAQRVRARSLDRLDGLKRQLLKKIAEKQEVIHRLERGLKKG